jgi:hypothetical protein
MNDTEIVDDDHFKISCKEDDFLYRLDVEDCSEDHYGKIKIVAKNENGESVKEVRSLSIFFYIRIGKVLFQCGKIFLYPSF